MMPLSNTNTAGLVQTLALNPLTVNARDGHFSVWNATAQDLARDGGLNTVTDIGARTAQVCYMRGVAETLRIQTSSGLPWFHRRVCFAYKGFLQSTLPADTSPGVSTLTYSDSSAGMQRLWLNLAINNSPASTAAIRLLLFKGRENLDWNDVMVAPLDTNLFTVKFDRISTYRSGNASGTVAERKYWHPMNKNLVYSDDEAGQTNDTNYISTGGKPGMGDYFVVDIIQAGTGGTVGDLIRVNSATTLYWHEK